MNERLSRWSDLPEHLVFWNGVLRNPRSVGALAPSSPYLARHMVREVKRGSRTVELGPGTGAFTGEIVARAGPDGRVLAVDIDAEFCKRVGRAWPQIDCVCASAETLPALATHRGMSPVDHIVSGLPFGSLPAKTTRLILDAVCETLRPGGTFTTFQYVHAYPLPPGVAFRRNLTALLGSPPDLDLVVRNVPPAFVLTWHRAK